MLIFAIITHSSSPCILGGIGFYRTSSQFAVEKRIEQIMTADAETPEEELAKPFVQRVLLPLGDSVARLFRGYTPAEVAERTQKKLVMAGLYPRVTVGAIDRAVLVQRGGLRDSDVPDDSGAGHGARRRFQVH